jgi:nucleoside-diphosphate-sugar epimerase
MRVFITGATGFIGTVVVQDLIRAGHQVLGMTRSEPGAAALTAAGAQVHRGHLEDLESLRSGAAQSDGVIHTAFGHDFSRFQEMAQIDRRAIEALGSALAGSDRPLVVTSGTLLVKPGQIATEDMPIPTNHAIPRVSEQTALSQVAKGVRACAVRLPQVHDRDKAGLVSFLIAIARQKGVSAYVGAGSNRWSAVHRQDVPPVYRLAFEKAPAGGIYHAVGEEGVPLKDIAAAIGRGLKVPVVSLSQDEAAKHFGPLAGFVGMDGPAASALTQQRLGWRPTQKTGLIADLDQFNEFKVSRSADPPTSGAPRPVIE